MKDNRAVAHAWIRKAESDLTNLEMCLRENDALDTACFHAQQVAEKYIKAYLTVENVNFPYIHNLEKLIELCAQRDPAFAIIKTMGQELTPYAITGRYDAEFWPSLDQAREARDAALAIKAFVVARLPAGPKTQAGD